MTKNTPGRDTDGTDTDTDNGTDTDTSIDIGNHMSVSLTDAPPAFTRIIQMAALSGGFATLVEDRVWSIEIDDWAIFVNGAEEEATTARYAPWGAFNIEPLTAVVFRTGLLAGVTDEESSQFLQAASRSEEVLLVRSLEARLEAGGFDFKTEPVEGE